MWFVERLQIANYNLNCQTVLAVLVGFHLDIEGFRDFVFIYRNGAPRRDDPLGRMTMHNLGTPFIGNIQHFWALPFIQESFGLSAQPTDVGPLKREDLPLNFLV